MKLRILLIEDSLLDAELLQARLTDNGIDCELMRVETETECLEALEKNTFDLILSDYSLPTFDGISALAVARRVCPEVPFIVVSGALGEELAIEILKSGATDYVLKQRLERLVPAVMRALREAEVSQQRAQAEATLRESEQRLKLALVTGRLGSWELNLATGEVYCSDICKANFGLPSEAALSYAALMEKIHPEDRDRVSKGVERAIENDSDYDVEYRNIWPDGSTHWVVARGKALYDADGKPLRLLGVCLDITARKQAEEERATALVRERQYTLRLQKLAEASLAINRALSLQERLQIVTEKAREIIEAHQSVTSITIDENWAQSVSAVSLSDKYGQWRDYAQKTDGSGIYSLVCRLNQPMRMTQAELESHPAWRGFGREADKHPPMRGWLAVPLIGRNGGNIGLIELSDKYEGEFTEDDEAILVQLAQMASAAIDNARLYEASQQANRLKDEFLAILSHELRSPLNPILGWAKLMRSRNLDAGTTAKAVETIERNAKLQTQLIDDLLDVSRILQGKLSLNVSDFDLVSVIEAAMETVRLAARSKSIDVRFNRRSESSKFSVLSSELEDSIQRELITQIDLPEFLVVGDPNRLQQVVWNLLSNAVKFTPAGGRVEIVLKKLLASDFRPPIEGEEIPSEISNLESEISYVLLQVIDNGKGISADFLPYVFDYFRQADSTTTRSFGGLGLGLAIARQIVELHGGTIRAESFGEGQGATFTVKLPLKASGIEYRASGMGAAVSDTDPSTNAPLAGLRLLVVEDDPDSREFITFVLEQSGAKVTNASAVSEAIAALERAKPDLLLSDIGMPEQDGYSLIEQLKTNERWAKIPAIAITAYAREEDRTQAILAGFQMHVPKPINPSELVEVVTNLARRKNT